MLVYFRNLIKKPWPYNPILVGLILRTLIPRVS